MKTLIFQTLFLSLFQFYLINTQWTYQEDIRTGINCTYYSGRRVILTGIEYVSINNTLAFNITYSSPLDQGPTASAGIGITGLDTLVTNDLAVNVTI